jgi:hypothetical protein
MAESECISKNYSQQSQVVARVTRDLELEPFIPHKALTRPTQILAETVVTNQTSGTPAGNPASGNAGNLFGQHA